MFIFKVAGSLVFLLLLLGFDTAPVAAQSSKKTIILVRHAEKLPPVDTDNGDPDLAPEGRERAERLTQAIKKYKPQEWNEIVVVVKDNVAHCTCNGDVLEEALKLPATGPIGLEADRGTMEYRNIRVKEE